MNNDDKCYRDWRRSEAYQVPVNELGEQMAEERYNEFKKGWQYGLRYAIFQLEQMHKENKDTHKFYFLAAEQMRELIK